VEAEKTTGGRPSMARSPAQAARRAKLRLGERKHAADRGYPLDRSQLEVNRKTFVRSELYRFWPISEAGRGSD
jgi:hypothetical protein